MDNIVILDYSSSERHQALVWREQAKLRSDAVFKEAHQGNKNRIKINSGCKAMHNGIVVEKPVDFSTVKAKTGSGHPCDGQASHPACHHSHLTPSVPRTGSRSTATLTRIKRLLK